MLSLSDHTLLDRFLESACTEIERRVAICETTPGVLRDGAVAFRAALQTATTRDTPITTVPVTEHLDRITASPLGQAMQRAAAEVSWIASPRTTDGGRDVALAPINDVRELGTLICGLLLVAPGAAYPEHAHPPQEIYLPIAGDGRWRYGGESSYRPLSADALVYNNPDDVHSVIAGDEPLLALYILWP